MITGKKDAEVIRIAINRLENGPTFSDFVPLLGHHINIQLAVKADAERQVKRWARTWLVNELNNLLPDSEKVKL